MIATAFYDIEIVIGQLTPFLLDTSKDAAISAEEWKEGCSKGWVSADAQTEKDMEGTPADPDTRR